jgi:hypothetical protein
VPCRQGSRILRQEPGILRRIGDSHLQAPCGLAFGQLATQFAALGLVPAILLQDGWYLFERVPIPGVSLWTEEANMKDASTYRDYAADCRRIAKTMTAKDKDVLLKMAEAWEERAREAEKSSHRTFD